MGSGMADRMSVTLALRKMNYRVVGIQFLLMLLVAFGSLFSGFLAGYSVFLGGMAVVLPNLWFAWLMSRTTRASLAPVIMKRFYIGVFVRLMLMVLLVFGVVQSGICDILWALIGFL